MPQLVEVPGYGQVEFPDEMSDADIVSAIQATQSKNIDRPERMGVAGNVLMGGLKGASDIGATLLYPVDYLLNKTGLSEMTNQQRRNELGKFFEETADPESLSFKGGALASQIAGTAGVGGLLGKGVTAAAPHIPAIAAAAPKIATALSTGGFKTGVQATTAKELAKNIGLKIGAGGVVGGVSSGLINPEYAEEGALIGGALPPAFGLLGEVGRAGKAALIDPLVNQKAILSKTLARAVGNETLAKTAAPSVHGVKFSAGQATGSQPLNAIEDSLRAVNPGGELSRQALSNNKSIADAISSLAGDEYAVAAAESARKTATAPLYSAASKSDATVNVSRVSSLIDRVISKHPANKALVTPLQSIKDSLYESYPLTERGADAWKKINEAMKVSLPRSDAEALSAARKVFDRVKNGRIDQQQAIEQLKGLSARGSKAKSIISEARDIIKAPDAMLMQKPHQIMSAIDNVKAMLSNKENAFVRGELNTIKRSLEHQLSKVVPEYRQAEQTFAQMSKPINQMQVAKTLANKLIPATSGDIPSRLNAASLANAMRNKDQIAKSATGFKRATMDNVFEKAQGDLINRVATDSSRIADMTALGAGYGSPTARRQSITNFVESNLANEAPVLSRAIGAFGNVPVANLPLRALSAAGNMFSGHVNAKMARDLENLLATNPDEVIRLIQDAQIQQQRALGLLAEPTVNPLLRSGIYQVPQTLSE